VRQLDATDVFRPWVSEPCGQRDVGGVENDVEQDRELVSEVELTVLDARYEIGPLVGVEREWFTGAVLAVPHDGSPIK
jgi:hypothetical protein